MFCYFSVTSNKKQKLEHDNSSILSTESSVKQAAKGGNQVIDSNKRSLSVSSSDCENATGRRSDESSKETNTELTVSENGVSTSSVEKCTIPMEIDGCETTNLSLEQRSNVETLDALTKCDASDKRSTEHDMKSEPLRKDPILKTIPEQLLLQNATSRYDGRTLIPSMEETCVNVNDSEPSEKSDNGIESSASSLAKAVNIEGRIPEVVQTSRSVLKSSVVTTAEQNMSQLKSKSPVKSRLRSSASSKLSSDISSPGSERSSISRSSDRPVSPRNDQGFSAEMFTHFMNFCGMNASDLPPVFQQNFVRVPGADQPGKTSSLQAGVQPVTSAIKPDIMKLPVFPLHPFGPLQANILANLHKLSSPPNQQVFPPFNLPGLPGKVQGSYQHGASVKGSSQPANVPPFSQSQGSRFPFSSMFPDIAFGGAPPQMTDFLWLSPNSKNKNKKGKTKKMECKKMENIFDSDVPPPNVDVSQLKDKGHGLIPKEKIASFIEHPTEFLKQQTELVNNSISSSRSSPLLENKKSKDSDQSPSEKTRSDSACSDRLNSPFKPEKDYSTEDVTMVIKDTITDSSVAAIENTLSIDNSNIATATLKLNETITSECSTSLAASVIQSPPVASAPPTPTTVVHHTPGSLSCHQMSLIKARQHVLGLKDGRPDIPKESLLHPLAAILNDPTLGQMFQQMFPEAVHEALMHSFDIPRTNICRPSAVLSQSPSIDGLVRISIPPKMNTQISGTIPPESLSNVCMTSLPTQRTSFPIQQILSNLSQGEFPASTLLSAAAKAQFVQQQNQLNLLMADQVSVGSVPGTLLPSHNPTISTQETQGVIRSTTSHVASLSAVESHSLPKAVVSLHETAKVSSIATDTLSTVMTEKSKTRAGAPKISELLSRNDMSKQTGRQDLHLINFIQQLQRPGSTVNTNTGQIPDISNLTDQTGQTFQTPVPVHNLDSQNIAAINVNNSALTTPVGNIVAHGQHTALVDPQLLQMYNSLGFSIQNSSEATQKQPFHSPDTASVDSNGATSSLGQPQLLNSHIPTATQYPCNVSTSGSSAPLLLRQPDPGNTSVLPNAQQFVPLLGNSNGQLLNIQGIQGVHHASNINTLLQQQPSFGQTPPAVQNNIPLQHISTNQTITLPCSVHDPGQNQLLISGPLAANSNTPSVMNLMNIQQSIGSGTHLTAMQLQTLQLQQQLMQQLQQVQGMQNLISQYNLQNIAVNNNNTTGERKQTENLTAAVTSNDTNVTNIVTLPSTSIIASQSVSAILPCTEVSASISSEISPTQNPSATKMSVDKEEPAVRKPNNIRVIAAADTTDDCSSTTRTVDIGTETDAIEEDNSEVQSEDEDEQNEDIDNTFTCKSGSDSDYDGGAVKHDDNDDDDVSSLKYICNKTLSPTTFPVSRIATLNTCLAIATQKGNTRSNELELRSFVEKSSLARSQNLSAELTKPAGNELKLKIKRKRLLENSIEGLMATTKKLRTTEKKEYPTLFEKKELRSSTLAATKASSSLAAGKDINRSKDSPTDMKSDLSPTLGDNDPIPSCSNENAASVEEIGRKIVISNEYLECDSSVDSDNSSQLVETSSSDSPKKDNLTSRIAAALSSQKGLWQLSCQKKSLAQVCEELKESQLCDATEEEITKDDERGTKRRRGVGHPDEVETDGKTSYILY